MSDKNENEVKDMDVDELRFWEAVYLKYIEARKDLMVNGAQGVLGGVKLFRPAVYADHAVQSRRIRTGRHPVTGLPIGG